MLSCFFGERDPVCVFDVFDELVIVRFLAVHDGDVEYDHSPAAVVLIARPDVYIRRDRFCFGQQDIRNLYLESVAAEFRRRDDERCFARPVDEMKTRRFVKFESLDDRRLVNIPLVQFFERGVVFVIYLYLRLYHLRYHKKSHHVLGC